ncbi:MAG: hypothetical protein V5B34_13225 [Accumulibacter sp.]|jgi:hypothetical protein
MNGAVVRRGKSSATRRLEKAILDIVEERSPITVRGVCYALFTREMIPSMATNETARVSRVMTDMRETGALDWTLIVDGSRAVDRVTTWRDPSSIIHAAVAGYRRNYWQDQPNLVEVWSEKSTVQGVLAPVLDEFGVTFRVMKGFGSFTAVRQAADDSLKITDGQQGIVLYLGDRDPSGMYMSEVDLPARLARYESEWQFSRIAVLATDTAGLPFFDVTTKAGDNRAAWFVKRYGNRCYELDALDPNDLRERVQEQIVTSLDLLAWERAKEVEQAEVASMRSFHRAWNAQLRQRGGA